MHHTHIYIMHTPPIGARRRTAVRARMRTTSYTIFFKDEMIHNKDVHTHYKTHHDKNKSVTRKGENKGNEWVNEKHEEKFYSS